MASCARAADKMASRSRRETVHRIHVVLHRALAQALRWEWIWVNPASTASPPSCEPAPIQPPSPEEVVRLLSHVAGVDPDFHTFLALAVSTGARRSQLGALRWGDVDLERGQIGFLRALLDARAVRYYARPRPVVPTGSISTPTVSRSWSLTWLGQTTGTRSGVELVARASSFRTTPETPWPPNWVTKRFIEYRESVKVDCRLHDLRHFMATTMLTAGVPITTVSARLSHTRTSTTLNVYTHAVPGGDAITAEVLGCVLREASHDEDLTAFDALSIADLPGGGTSASIEVVDAPHLFQVKVA